MLWGPRAGEWAGRARADWRKRDLVPPPQLSPRPLPTGQSTYVGIVHPPPLIGRITPTQRFPVPSSRPQTSRRRAPRSEFFVAALIPQHTLERKKCSSPLPPARPSRSRARAPPRPCARRFALPRTCGRARPSRSALGEFGVLLPRESPARYFLRSLLHVGTLPRARSRHPPPPRNPPLISETPMGSNPVGFYGARALRLRRAAGV